MIAREKPKDNPFDFDLVWPDSGDDPLATSTAARLMREMKPDLVFLAGEPGNTVSYTRIMPPDTKMLVYQLIEGAPIVNGNWQQGLSVVHNVAATEYGADTLERTIGRREPWVYSGVDHDVFNVTGTREQLRETMIRGDTFIVMTVAQNVRRKQLPRLIEAISILRYKYNRENVVLYLHSSPFQNHWLEGWNLFEIVQSFGIADRTVFHPGLAKGLHSFVPDRTNDLAYPGLVEMYNAADLFVLPSQVEGFGLPIAEAMACGLPVLVTKYAAGWELAKDAGRGLPVHDWEIAKSGQRYANVSPADIADAILKLMRNPNELRRMKEAGLKRAQDFQWDTYNSTLVREAERVYRGDQEGSRDEQDEDTRKASEEAHERLPEIASENHRTSRELQPTG